MQQYYSVHPEHAKAFGTAELRKNFLVEGLFQAGRLKLVYSPIKLILA